MKNVIYILVDALSYDNVGKREYRNTPTPFLDSLAKQSTFFKNVYTQAPYTEAAFVSTLCGENVLDHGGYLLGMEKCDTCYGTLLKKRGYHTLSTFSPYIMSKSYIRDIDEYFYSRVFSLNPLKLYRINYYAQKFNEHTITDKEYIICEKIMIDAFEIWIEQLYALKNKDEKAVMIQDIVNGIENIDDVIFNVEGEYTKFKNNPTDYLEEMFREGGNHNIYKISYLSLENKVSVQTKSYIKNKYKDFVNVVQDKKNSYKKNNEKIDFKYLFDLMINDEQTYHGAISTYRRYENEYNDDTIKESINSHVSEKVTISAFRQLNIFKNKIIELDKKNENYFSFIHLEDFHLPSMIYSYDIENKDVIDKEFKILSNYVRDIPENYRGNLLADMSALYVDSKIEAFFNELNDKLRNDFIFVVTADHGYPCNYNPPRPIIFNSFYQENYHIPLYLYDSTERNPEENLNLHSSLDIMTMIMNKVNNQEILLENREYVLIEYPGPGCPVIHSKELYYAIYDGTYKIGIKSKLNDDVDYTKVVLATNFKEDPDERKNLVRKVKKNKRMRELLCIVNERHKEIREKFANEKFYDELLKGN